MCKGTGYKKQTNKQTNQPTDCVCSFFRQFTALLQQTVSAERRMLHIVDSMMGNRSLQFSLHTVSAEPHPAEPEGLLPQKWQLQCTRRRESKHGHSVSHHCSFPISGRGTERARHRRDFMEPPYKLSRKKQTCCGVRGYKSCQMEPDHSPADQVSPCY